MRNLVVGGAGFIGSHIVRSFLKNGEEVDIVDDFSVGRVTPLTGGVKFYLSDILRFVPEKKYDRYIFSAGVVSTKDFISAPKRAFDVTFEGAKRTAEFALRDGARMIFLSTSEVYGEANLVAEEDDFVCRLSKREGYDIGKIAAEAYLDIFKKEGLLLTVIRPFNVYGPYEYRDGVIPKFISLALKGKPLTIYNGGKQIRAFTYIDDFIDGFNLVKDKDGIFNIGTHFEATINELAKIIADEILVRAGKEVKFKRVKKDLDEIQFRFPDISKIQKLGYKPKVNLVEGIQKTVDWAISEGGIRIRHHRSWFGMIFML